MKLTWIVVANNSIARFFTAESESSSLTEIETLTHLEGRLHDREITSDFPGKIKGEGAVGHAFEQPTDPKKHEADNFAHLVAKHLEAAHNEHKFEQLLLVAEPSFLGLLRNQLSGQIKKRVCFELDSNIVTLSADEIRTHLPEHLPKLQ
ncbi:MAG: host attachment protein [Methylococcaceae bacterium]|nr:host attachment protein [Methylococcaceae bacterium]MDD1608273.1 host attachment protein [Methylococcaceae bacterium]MDD1610139.1 host attachment protein [Methylococcaceae bacterium]MDD1615757.1 host attachment protein [Methylococcaceae bacterium]OYV19517.1 MAG: host cell attachment-required protein [Methylococcaceae bacterium NSP1-2]